MHMSAKVRVAQKEAYELHLIRALLASKKSCMSSMGKGFLRRSLAGRCFLMALESLESLLVAPMSALKDSPSNQIECWLRT